MIDLGDLKFFESLLGLFIRDLLDLKESLLDAVSGANNSDDSVGSILGLGDRDLGRCLTLQLLEFGASFSQQEPVVLLGNVNGGIGLGLEVHQDHPLGFQDVSLLPGDEEGEAAILGAAHLNLASAGRFNSGQLLVGVTHAEAFNVHGLPLLSRDVENLNQRKGLRSLLRLTPGFENMLTFLRLAIYTWQCFLTSGVVVTLTRLTSKLMQFHYWTCLPR